MVETDLQRFGARVRAERGRLGISQEELAARAGLHRTYLGGVERGERNLGLLNIIRIASALNLRASVLLESLPLDKPISHSMRADQASASATRRK